MNIKSVLNIKEQNNEIYDYELDAKGSFTISQFMPLSYFRNFTRLYSFHHLTCDGHCHKMGSNVHGYLQIHFCYIQIVHSNKTEYFDSFVILRWNHRNQHSDNKCLIMFLGLQCNDIKRCMYMKRDFRKLLYSIAEMTSKEEIFSYE